MEKLRRQRSERQLAKSQSWLQTEVVQDDFEIWPRGSMPNNPDRKLSTRYPANENITTQWGSE